ncbi:MAG: zinc dependent phospholipase C family protein [Peptococcaceae bacterium]|nr:zinc dependent phospholipase C family protein [Peptococcaceae bacterium]MDH7524666.1 zinc dependent phospholipase C family protein [Peptococcaceae bacterium]
MPGFITHYLCGHQVLQNLKDEPLRELIAGNRQVFNLGTQGPDIFFYYRAWPWTANRGLNKTGDMLHLEKVNAFFANAVSYIMQQNGRERELLTAYLCGYACHYSLDCHAHPYVYYRTGFARPGENPDARHVCRHRLFETAADVLMLERLLAQKPADLKVHNLISLNTGEAQSIGRLYRVALQNTYGIRVSAEQVSRAARDMATAQAALRDRTGLKRPLLIFVEKLLGRPPLISSMVYPTSIDSELDCLNLQRRPWRLPWDNSTPFTLSFPEMFLAAALEAEELCLALYRCLHLGDSPVPALNRIGNRSLVTGADCGLDLVFTHYECIFDR